MSNAPESTVPNAEKKKAGCCGGAKDGEQPAAPAVAADETKPASHAAHDPSKHTSGAGCCGGGNAHK
jgi:hypothetical protein